MSILYPIYIYLQWLTYECIELLQIHWAVPFLLKSLQFPINKQMVKQTILPVKKNAKVDTSSTLYI